MLFALDDQEIRLSPATALAQSVGISPSVAARQIREVIAAGLARRVGRGLIVAMPRGDSIVHAHHPDEPCFAHRIGRRVGTELDPQVLDPGGQTIPTTPRSDRAIANGVCVCIDQVRKEIPVSKSKVDRLKRVVEVFGCRQPTPRKATPADGVEVRLLAEGYVARRRRVDPEYEPRPGDYTAFIQAHAYLKARMINPDQYGDYLDNLFERFARIANGSIPPARMIKAEGFVEPWVCSLGRRPLNVTRARRMLVSAGFGDIDQVVVTNIARHVAEAGGAVPEGLKPRDREAVEWLLPRLGEVGYLSGKVAANAAKTPPFVAREYDV
jgi:hypothetical protein